MMHNNENEHPTMAKLESVLNEYLIEGMQIISERRKKGNFLIFNELIEKYGKEELEKKYNNNITKLWQGYCNSTFFGSAVNHQVCNDTSYEILPDNSYLLLNNKNPSDALHDLLFNTEVVLFIDGTMAVMLAQYYAILQTLKRFKGDDEGCQLFNLAFSHPQAKMFISTLDVALGTRDRCATTLGFSSPFNPLLYFMNVVKDEIKMGDIVCYGNYSEYKVKHPLGKHHIYTLVCVSDNPKKFICLDMDKPSNEQAIREKASHDYNANKPKWMSASWVTNMPDFKKSNKNPRRKQVRHDIAPHGFKNELHMRFDLERILALVLFPRPALKKIKAFLAIELRAIDGIKDSVLVEQSKTISLGNIEAYFRLPDTIGPTFTLPPSHIPIEDDNYEELQTKKNLAFKLARSRYEISQFYEAARFFESALKCCRAIYHYIDRMKHENNTFKESDLVEADRHIAVACYNFSAALRKVNHPGQAIHFLREANEIYEMRGIKDEVLQEMITGLNECLKEVKFDLNERKFESSITHDSRYKLFTHQITPNSSGPNPRFNKDEFNIYQEYLHSMRNIEALQMDVPYTQNKLRK